MKLPHFGSRAIIAVLLTLASLAASGCNNVGVGVSMGTTPRWGGGATGPPIFVGGPSVQ